MTAKWQADRNDRYRFVEFRNGKVVEHRGLIDLLGVREQLVCGAPGAPRRARQPIYGHAVIFAVPLRESDAPQ